ncbi:ABC transporter permease [Bacillus sp. AK128]
MTKFYKNVSLMIGLVFLFILVSIALFPELFPFVDTKLERILYILNEDKKPVMPPFPPSEGNIFGTDHWGRDLFSMIILGTRETLIYVLLISTIRFVVGVPFSFLAFHKIGGSHTLLAISNRLFTYVPSIVTIIILMTLPPILFSEFRPYLVVLIIALVELNKVSTSLVEEIRHVYKQEYMVAAKSLGTKPLALIKRYLLPQLYPNLIVSFSLDLARNFVILAQLGFFQFFIAHVHVQLEDGSWEFQNTSLMWPNFLGNILSDLRGPIWIPFFATLAISFAIITFTLIGNGLTKQYRSRFHS